MSATLDDILKSLSLQELLTAREVIEERVSRAQRAEQNAAKKKILELARLYGIHVNFVEAEKASGRNKGQPKYRNPENLSQTWSGHGKRPAWLAALLAKGHTLEEFHILIQVE